MAKFLARFPRRSALAVAVVVTGLLGVAVSVGVHRTFAVPTAAAETDSIAANPCGRNWVAAWAASPRAVYAPEAPHGSLDGRTLRLIVRVQTDGDQLRFRLSNRYGREPLEIGAATVGVAREQPFAARVEAGLEGMRSLPVTFNGRPSVEIPPGVDIVSDPVEMNVGLRAPVAVSLFIPRQVFMVSEHTGALQTSYLSGPGDFTAEPTGTPFTTPFEAWPILTGVEVRAPRAMNSVLLMGDSLTDGVGSAVDRNDRWSDALADWLRLPGGAPKTVVINGGLAGNELLTDAPESVGDSPTRRLQWELPLGVTDVVLQIGNNDIARGRSALEITDAMTRFVVDARARGVRVHLTTITPSTAAQYGSPAANAVRRQVNDWIRAGGPVVSDGVFDFAQAVDATDQPTLIGDLLDSGDGLHLSAAGYRALARAVDSGQIAPPPCP